MKSSRFIYTPKGWKPFPVAPRCAVSRRSVLSVVALPALLRPTAWGQTTPTFDYLHLARRSSRDSVRIARQLE